MTPQYLVSCEFFEVRFEVWVGGQAQVGGKGKQVRVSLKIDDDDEDEVGL
jgi:hypothetical protein